MQVPANDAPEAPPAADAGPEFLTIAEAAAWLRFNPKSFTELVGRGEVPGASKIGGVWRIHRPTVVASFQGQIGASPAKKGRRRR